MVDREPIVLVSGLVNAESILRLRSIAAPMPRAMMIASPLLGRGGQSIRTDCLDMTAITDEETFAALCRASATPGQLVLVRDHQLGFNRIVEVINRLSLRCMVLYPYITYDYDVSWAVEHFTEMSCTVAVEYFVLDLFCDIERSWDFFLHRVGDDELNAADVEHLCARFPSLLTADLRPDNVTEVASFPSARGILLACDELKPRVPLERHTLPFDTILDLLRILFEQPGGATGGHTDGGGAG